MLFQRSRVPEFFRLLQCHSILQREHARARTYKLRHRSSASELLTDIVAERADIRSFGTIHQHRHVWKFDLLNLNPVNRDPSCLTLYNDAFSG